MNEIIAHGIDISEHQTRQARIDFNQVKASGVNFCIVRVGWAGYDGPLDVDNNLDNTINDAVASGVDVGLYVYAYTRTPAAARIAAQQAVDIAKQFKIMYPIVFDVEETTDRCLLNQGKSGLTDTVIAFLQEVERLGYYAMWYTYSAFVQQYLDYSRLKAYDFWQADYRTAPMDIPRGIWQYVGNNGICPGVNGACDRNYAYKDYPTIIMRAKLNGISDDEVPPSGEISDIVQRIKALESENAKLIVLLDDERSAREISEQRIKTVVDILTAK